MRPTAWPCCWTCGGYDSRTCHRGAMAQETALTYRPQVVLLDVGMPGVDGFKIDPGSAEPRSSESAGARTKVTAVSRWRMASTPTSRSAWNLTTCKSC
jgi:hypothetical protein